MAAALVGRKWDAVPIEVLFYHRESLATLSPQAFHAYLPAYLLACLASDDPFDKHGADIRGYLLFALGSWPHQSDPDRPAETRDRLSILDSRATRRPRLVDLCCVASVQPVVFADGWNSDISIASDASMLDIAKITDEVSSSWMVVRNVEGYRC